MVCVGYAGIDAFDLVLYIGRTITKLKYKVLIVDLSDTESILHTMKYPADLDSTKDIIHYRDIHYTRKVPSMEELTEFKKGVILVVFGWNYTFDIPLEISTINYVVNPMPNMITKLAVLINKAVNQKCNKNILLRDMISLEDLDRLYRISKWQSSINKINYLYLDVTEYEKAVRCQLTQTIQFRGISNRMRNYLRDQIAAILPEVQQSKIRKALAVASRGV